jgi:diguanylate cyclase (GGDEF)-like protein
MMQSFAAFLERMPKSFLIAFGLASVMIVGGLDLLTITAPQFVLLYLAPIVFTAWYVGAAAGCCIAAASLLYGILPALAGWETRAAWDGFVISGASFFLVAFTAATLRQKVEWLSRMATRDALTGLPNAQGFFELMARETVECGGQNPLTFVYVDLGGVERVNRSLGHSAGDQVLCSIAQVIKENMPRPDLIGRVGGTTFAMLLPDAATESVKATIRELQTRLYEVRRTALLAITFSINVVTCAEAPRTVAGLMHEVEKRLQRSKARHHDALNIVHVDSSSVLH